MEPSPQISDMKQVKCPSCGATLSYKPGTTSQVCEYCHSTFEIASEQELVQAAQAENDLQTALAGEWQQAQAGGQASVVKCPSCGAETALGTSMFSGSCTFCGSVLTVKGILLPVADDGTFVMPFVLNPRNMVTEIVIDSLDPAGNVREIRQNITYMPVKTGEKKETNWGLWFLVISLIILIVVGIVSAYVVRSRRDEWLEMEAARTTPVAPIEPLEPVKGAETLPGPDEIGMREEGKGGKPPEGPAAASATAARPRPRPPQARRAPPARPAPKAPGAPEGDSKDLSDQGAEAESKAEETDQEGM